MTSTSLQRGVPGQPPGRTVGIMSMQRIFNYGSSLQGYALRRMLEGLAGDIRVSFVDYRPGDILVKTEGTAGPVAPWRRALAKVQEYNAVDAPLAHKLRFFNHKRTYGARNFPLIGLTAESNYDQDLDVLVIGSDEVFNCVQSNTNVGYARDLFGHNSPARKTVSYAASFGNTTLAGIDKFGIRDDLAEDLSRFEAISVRDRNSAEIVAALTGRAPELHVDPALAYDLMGLETRIPSERPHPGKYLIVYGYSGRLSHDENEILRRYARSIGAEILCFGGVQECCDRFVDCSPFELLAYFRDAAAVVTDTFHGTIFAIINQRPFATIVRSSAGHGYGNEQKLGFLLETFGLTSQRLTDLSRVEEVLVTPVDHEAIGRRVALERARALSYLENVVR